MRFKCIDFKSIANRRWKKKYERLINWHKSFCWWPRNVDGVCVWLESVNRIGKYYPSNGYIYEEPDFWAFKYTLNTPG